MTATRPPHANEHTRRSGLGRVLIAVYAVLALAALGRSFFQIATKFHDAPVAYALSAVAALIYVVATIALIAPGRTWMRVAWVTISIELAGVLIVGFLSIFLPVLFPHDTVWSVFGRGYLFLPLVMPILGLLWLRRSRSPLAVAGETR
ncbi:membrane protein [Alpinimonas psychrophila]|uniref:Integral membrane protein n=1 Tax=Alpinimonas psychrophila TaxID=748908 RepID=A0A7W3PNP8_9MICO|nr:hypothetical protein [Alpinimonas psychrophila]MBA8829069.1 hypothetical protein [Alpinimonas psychrophila]